MSSFTRAIFEPTGRKQGWRPLWRLVDGFRFDIGYLGSGLAVACEAGELTDGPSIPSWLCWLLPVMPIELMIKSSLVHDALRRDLRFSKLEGDAIFLMALDVEGCPAIWRELAYIAVRFNRSRRTPPLPNLADA